MNVTGFNDNNDVSESEVKEKNVDDGTYIYIIFLCLIIRKSKYLNIEEENISKPSAEAPKNPRMSLMDALNDPNNLSRFDLYI